VLVLLISGHYIRFLW